VATGMTASSMGITVILRRSRLGCESDRVIAAEIGPKGRNIPAQGGAAAPPHRHQVKEQLIFQKMGSPFKIAG
jgi:hypothetical protein